MSAMTLDPVHESERDVMQDISYFEGYNLPNSPPETPPTKNAAVMALRERSHSKSTPMHISLEKMFPRTPPQSPRMGLKRTFSNNVNGTGNFGPLSPPATPPTTGRSRAFSGLGLSRSLTDKILEGQVSVNGAQRPTVVTIDIIGSPTLSRRSTISRSSSYSATSYSGFSARSATSVSSMTTIGSRDPLDRVRDYQALSTDAKFPSPTMLAAPEYSPPPNTPATFEPIHQIHDYSNLAISPFAMEGIQHRGSRAGSEPKDNEDPFNPFSYTGPTQYPNHSSQPPAQTSNGYQGFTTQPDFRGAEPGSDFAPGSSIIDLEKARNRGVRRQNSSPSRHCARKLVICCAVCVMLVVLAVVIVVVVIVRIHHHTKHHKRSACTELPGMYIEGEWQNEYLRCT